MHNSSHIHPRQGAEREIEQERPIFEDEGRADSTAESSRRKPDLNIMLGRVVRFTENHFIGEHASQGCQCPSREKGPQLDASGIDYRPGLTPAAYFRGFTNVDIAMKNTGILLHILPT